MEEKIVVGNSYPFYGQTWKLTREDPDEPDTWILQKVFFVRGAKRPKTIEIRKTTKQILESLADVAIIPVYYSLTRTRLGKSCEYGEAYHKKI